VIQKKLPGASDKHVVNNGKQLHNTFIKMKILQTFKKVRIPDKNEANNQYSRLRIKDRPTANDTS